ncbi:hypothetical protein ID866_6900 [Astraeus odoratus]|nr:hypothetical protein ID866_6900 [Astraeus odoratus]
MERSSISALPEPSTSSYAKKLALLQAIKLPRKPSLPSLFASSSSFVQSPTTEILPSRASCNLIMSRNNTTDALPTSDFSVPAPSLLDDDPFAMLMSSIATQSRTRSLLDMGCPPLSESAKPTAVELCPRAHVPPASSARPKSSSHGQIRPAHTRPAFAPRPSLPSLRTLAQMNVAVPRKVRKGTVGARLPHEPWNLTFSSDEPCLSTGNRYSSTASTGETTSSASPPRGPESENSDITPSNDGFDGEPSPDGGSDLTSVDGMASRAPIFDEITSPRSLPVHDDADSLPSLYYTTTSEPSSSALSRASSLQFSRRLDTAPHQNNRTNNDTLNQKTSVNPNNARQHPVDAEEDPLSYHSDFDYYTQSLSDLSDFEQDEPQTQEDPVATTPITPGPVGFEPRTSSDTMRSRLGERVQTTRHPTSVKEDETPHVGYEWRGQRGVPEKHTSASDRKLLEQDMHRKVGSRSRSPYDGGQRAGSGGQGGGDNRHQTRQSSSNAVADYSSSSESEDDNTVYYSIDGKSDTFSRAQSRAQSRHSKAGGSDDDVPLAQRMPTALKAQKSIRQQLRDERQQRKLEREKTRHVSPPPLPPAPRAGKAPSPSVPKSATHEGRKRSASITPAPRAPSVKQESNAAWPPPMPPEDLSRRLLRLQTSSPPTTLDYNTSGSFSTKIRSAHSTATSPTRTAHVQHSTVRPTEAPPQDKSLKTMRSFHRSDRRRAGSPSVEPTSAQNIARSMTVGARQPPDSLPGRSSTDVRGRPGRDGRSDNPTIPDQGMKSGRTSEDSWRPSGNSRPSIDREGSAVNPRVLQRPPLQPPPQQPTTKIPVIQQRIFIGDMQRFNTVEITPSTSAGGVIKLLTSQGILDRSASWMLFELAQDYGMERPIRDYERLSDVSGAWDKDKLLNAFVIKSTPMARLLSPLAIPTSSPMHRGWVEWESKRGKWSRRWMELREHGLWLSKRDTGKDETFLCTVSNFDAYYVTRRHKSPKPFVFAVKSTDHLSLFENAADYLHVFSCNPKEGEKWIEAILIARVGTSSLPAFQSDLLSAQSYVLHQEKNVLYTKASEVQPEAKPLSRSRTRKLSLTGRPTQPLINVAPPFNTATTNVVFEPGSLLAKR